MLGNAVVLNELNEIISPLVIFLEVDKVVMLRVFVFFCWVNFSKLLYVLLFLDHSILHGTSCTEDAACSSMYGPSYCKVIDQVCFCQSGYSVQPGSLYCTPGK